MDKKIKAKWVKALRSGDYLQGRGALLTVLNEGDKNPLNRDRAVKERTETYCCLGVLCDIGGGKIKELEPYPSKTFCKKMGLSELMQDRLAGMNDGGDTFKKIATYIEKNMDKDQVALDKEAAEEAKQTEADKRDKKANAKVKANVK